MNRWANRLITVLMATTATIVTNSNQSAWAACSESSLGVYAVQESHGLQLACKRRNAHRIVAGTVIDDTFQSDHCVQQELKSEIGKASGATQRGLRRKLDSLRRMASYRRAECRARLKQVSRSIPEASPTPPRPNTQTPDRSPPPAHQMTRCTAQGNREECTSTYGPSSCFYFVCIPPPKICFSYFDTVTATGATPAEAQARVMERCHDELDDCSIMVCSPA